LESASHCFSRALRNRFFLDINTPIDSYAGSILSYQAMQQPDKANQTLSLMMEFSQESSNPAHIMLARSVQARLSLLQSNLTSAVHWLETSDVSSDAGTMFFFLDLPRITQCRVWVVQGSETNLHKAEEALQGYSQLCQATHNTPKMIEILLLQVVVHYKQKRYDEAISKLEQALLLARPGGFIRSFVDHGQPVAMLLARLLEQDVAVDFVRQILAAFPSSAESSRSHEAKQSLIDPLTKRELQTLRLLATDLSPNEIAAELVVSVSTVRMHSKRIYRKLNVHSRLQAVLRANEF
jgi:LuxR family maltose regulon positive regulatory protein